MHLNFLSQRPGTLDQHSDPEGPDLHLRLPQSIQGLSIFSLCFAALSRIGIPVSSLIILTCSAVFPKLVPKTGDSCKLQWTDEVRPHSLFLFHWFIGGGTWVEKLKLSRAIHGGIYRLRHMLSWISQVGYWFQVVWKEKKWEVIIMIFNIIKIKSNIIKI